MGCYYGELFFQIFSQLTTQPLRLPLILSYFPHQLIVLCIQLKSYPALLSLQKESTRMLFSQHDELNLNNPGNVSNSKLSKLYKPRSSVKITARDTQQQILVAIRYIEQELSNWKQLFDNIISHDILTCIFLAYVRINDTLQKTFSFTFIM